MADPNTQIDWWIAQTWQEAQGGAENDALVAWLHENGLTAASSYTILQAALSCPPETAKEIVYSHPVWAGEEPVSETDSLSYTTDTLEPEPEPDPTFELDDWAEQIEEEAPVYGEEGFQPDPDAGATPPAYARKPTDLTDTNGAGSLEAMQSGIAEPVQTFDPAPAPEPEPEPEEPAAPVDTAPPAPEIAPPEPLPAAEIAPVEPPPAAEIAPLEPPPAAESMPDEPLPASAAGQTQPADQPESAVLLADAVGMEPAGAMLAPLVYEPLPEIQIVQPVATAEPLFALPQRDRGPLPPLFPPANDTGPSPAQRAEPGVIASSDETIPGPADDPAHLAEPVQVTAPNGLDPDPAPDLAVMEEEREIPPATDMDSSSDLRSGSPPTIGQDENEPHPGVAESMDEESGGPDATELEQEAPPPAELDNTGDLPPDPHAAVGRDEAEPQDQMAVSTDQADGELAPTDWERELPPDEEEEAINSAHATEEHNSDIPSSVTGEGGGGEEGDAAPRPRKQVLLDRSGEVDESGLTGEGQGGMPLGDTPEEMAAAAKKLGIDFREVDMSDAGVDPEMAKAAKDLGISFREGSGGGEQLAGEDAVEARKLGISFREGNPAQGKPKKPMLVKYMPIFMGIIILSFLALLGVTFADTIIEWLAS